MDELARRPAALVAHATHHEPGRRHLARSIVFHGRECRLSRVGIELFERAASGGGQLLRAELASGSGSGQRTSVLLLTFDVGRVLVRAEPATGGLVVEHVETSEKVPDGLVDASEEEPWWRVLGQPIVGAWPLDDQGAALRIQFRADDQNPRRVTLEARGGQVAIGLESPAAVREH